MLTHGFLNIDKPAGVTSHDVVATIRRLVGQKRVGHGGTLDPAATGVLPIALGEATKLVGYLVEGRKGYRAEVRLGVATTTDDADGEVIAARPVPPLTHADLRRALESFSGVIQQVPPLYSAIQIGGQRMYDRARRGEMIALAPRAVEIYRIDLLDWQPPIATLAIECGKGTYVRAIARDLGALLGCGAHLQALRRTRVGPLTLESSVSLQTLLDDPVQLTHALLPPEMAVADWPRADVDESVAQRIRNGMPVPLALAGDQVRAHGPDGRLMALLRRDGDRWRPFRVFRWS